MTALPESLIEKLEELRDKPRFVDALNSIIHKTSINEAIAIVRQHEAEHAQRLNTSNQRVQTDAGNEHVTSGYSVHQDDDIACDCHWHRTGQFDVEHFMCGEAMKNRVAGAIQKGASLGNPLRGDDWGGGAYKAPRPEQRREISDVVDEEKIKTIIFNLITSFTSGMIFSARNSLMHVIFGSIRPYLRTTEPVSVAIADAILPIQKELDRQRDNYEVYYSDLIARVCAKAWGLKYE